MVAPLAPTVGDRVIDFFVVSKSLAHAAEVACTIADEGFEPHNPVRLYIESNARHAMVRNLKVPGGFNAELPVGPPNKSERAVVDSDVHRGSSNGSNYVGLLRQVEKELCEVEGLTGSEAAKKCGREIGAKYCWQNAMGDNLADSAKTTSVSRAWRRSAKWLRDISKTKLKNKARAVQWRLMHYTHPTPDMATATPEQLAAMQAFDDWQRLLTRGMLLQPAVVELLHAVAIKQAESEERAARAAALNRGGERVCENSRKNRY